MPTPNEFSKIDSPRGPVPRDASEPEAVNRDDCLPVGRSDNFLFADDSGVNDDKGFVGTELTVQSG